ncbi:MAG: MEDS domain-containing protein [Candidatus Aminicenantes bacterium]|nr:MEDS domain-containing protein [Candidatus Aminicenantes bacterium]MCK5004035.1 MEDS domain-containing protein [Candidatus Aminicenantes bacterium]
MCKNQISVNLGFTEEKFPAGTHMCLIYNNEEEQRNIISKFVEGGLSAGEKVAYFADEMEPDQISEWLASMGVAVPNLKESSNFSVSSTAETYHPEGIFKPEEMLDNLKVFYETAKEENFPASRVTGEMSWALKNIPGSNRLMEYEAKVNDVLVKYPVTAVCQYDANEFDGATLLECLKVHPYIIAQGQIVRNPYYMNTEDFLKEWDLK